MKLVSSVGILLALSLCIGIAYFLANQTKVEPEQRGSILRQAKSGEKVEWVDLQSFKDLTDPSFAKFSAGLRDIEVNWRAEYKNLLFEVIRFTRDPVKNQQMIAVYNKMTRTNVDTSNFEAWSETALKDIGETPPYYSDFKYFFGDYKDKTLGEYFKDSPESTIRMEEIVWGGVPRDGIPPLRQPKMISAEEALYLDDSNVVFGVEINGDARAYPKRILAWHEMFNDTIGGISVCGVY